MDSTRQMGMSLAAVTQEVMVARVTRDARRIFGDTIEEATLVAWAEAAVSELWGDSVKVTSFVPVLALRQISLRAAEFAGIEGA